MMELTEKINNLSKKDLQNTLLVAIEILTEYLGNENQVFDYLCKSAKVKEYERLCDIAKVLQHPKGRPR